MSRAQQLKDDGNRHFKRGDFLVAESLYSQAGCFSSIITIITIITIIAIIAIIAILAILAILAVAGLFGAGQRDYDSNNATLYTNRAIARLKLELWDSVVADCESALALPTATDASSLKAQYYLCQACLRLGDPEAAVAAGLASHALCVAINSTSLAAVTDFVLHAKKARWEQRERQRIREEGDLERDLLRLLRAERDKDAAAAASDDERRMVEEEAAAKEESLRNTFERSRKLSGEGKREVPEWAIDDISFCFMVDPVMTKNGHSYERVSIMKYLRHNPYDPLTREPLAPSDLRPNRALREACEQFLFENGWAADY
ncbi:U-box domain containing protein [Cordyceps fumosorosea ARSEF 2679]|uniref:U-box domain containing protein n=1 Tax=Cordyceps fumosorosea (strain ARSEF 2679) TaxID=1081104 RepID=A0A167RNV4_CORFA|nr:U-box domain containing protein [Cordyceps fumosorosea ARSEF 2679]OAA58778.1 U-box domain containing protein [Cordyceps fumosorosea ARSEF 2679]